MNEIRKQVEEWLSDIDTGDGVSKKNASSIISKLTDAEIATVYIAIIKLMS